MPLFVDINFTSSNRRPTQAYMWETNTFDASFHARLNVAPQHAAITPSPEAGIQETLDFGVLL
jgi:hypothetical protein